ncbi:hypothetical protein [Persicirhabdus sediminis]|uniref:Uncharacterized protein n=1 Tax=Persicirhabdus sediminis TaxID=454144 RepID=A0A8J7SPF3_9BACT|nr:hypothetical protein [Persicirhabdus sediminis]MBK1792303.1 hypothetical protein [Persicirhabdus sediminis]
MDSLTKIKIVLTLSFFMSLAGIALMKVTDASYFGLALSGVFLSFITAYGYISRPQQQPARQEAKAPRRRDD